MTSTPPSLPKAKPEKPETIVFNDIPPAFEPTPAHPIRVRSRPMPAGVRIPQHTHAWAQLAYSSRGVLRMTTPGTTWMVPPSRAIWVPPNVTHEVSIVEDAFLRTLYVDESVVPPGLGECRVV
ncbi:MAG TPA: AraC family ligand binding domain-containing protein, partial [Paraburkholderia sp.]